MIQWSGVISSQPCASLPLIVWYDIEDKFHYGLKLQTLVKEIIHVKHFMEYVLVLREITHSNHLMEYFLVVREIIHY